MAKGEDLEAQRNDELAIAKQGLLARMLKRLPDCGIFETAIDALSFVRRDATTEPASYMHEPSVCLIAQGAKRILLGKESYSYDANHFLITALDVPVVAQVTRASAARPYLSLKLKLDQRTVSQLMADSSVPMPRAASSGEAMVVSELSLPLLNAFIRLIDLLDTPDDIPALAPLIEREICYRLLASEQGPRLRQIAVAGSQGYQVARAIDWLKSNFAKSFSVDELASISRMSASSFHHHFKALTSMSPLQYQKCLRLQEARRLMLAERLDAASAAYRVGYESPSQFSREYSRMFEASPGRDIRALLSESPIERANP
jgi:AraC-type DNA-binding domain-containing proteins